jgi:hypothetical protein
VKEALSFVEERLQTSGYLGGNAPSKLDAEYLAKIKPFADSVSPADYPSAFAWLSLTLKYSDKSAADWA